MAPVLAWDDIFAGDANTSSDDVLELGPPFLDDLVLDDWAPPEKDCIDIFYFFSYNATYK